MYNKIKWKDYETFKATKLKGVLEYLKSSCHFLYSFLFFLLSTNWFFSEILQKLLKRCWNLTENWFTFMKITWKLVYFQLSFSFSLSFSNLCPVDVQVQKLWFKIFISSNFLSLWFFDFYSSIVILWYLRYLIILSKIIKGLSKDEHFFLFLNIYTLLLPLLESFDRMNVSG